MPSKSPQSPRPESNPALTRNYGRIDLRQYCEVEGGLVMHARPLRTRMSISAGVRRRSAPGSVLPHSKNQHFRLAVRLIQGSNFHKYLQLGSFNSPDGGRVASLALSVAPNSRCLTPENVEFIAMHTRAGGYFAVGARLLKSTSDAAAR
jgi:hypothetical protein